MSTSVGASTEERRLLAEARAGNDRAFRALYPDDRLEHAGSPHGVLVLETDDTGVTGLRAFLDGGLVALFEA